MRERERERERRDPIEREEICNLMLSLSNWCLL
jgi:hypothetical protein